MKLNKLVGVVCLPFLMNCGQSEAIPAAKESENMKYEMNVWSVTPNWGVYEPGMIINIEGIGFEEKAKAFIGGRPCKAVIVVDFFNLQCMVARPMEFGDHSITVVNPDGDIKPIAHTPDQLKKMCDKDDISCLENDGLVYFYFVNPIEKL